jgi:trigger factor
MDEELTGTGSPDRNFTVTVDSPSQCKRTLSLEIGDGALQGEKARVVEKLRKEVRVPGFRKGKVPAGYIRKHYGDEVQADAVQNLLTKAYQEAIVAENLRPLGDPRFENLGVADGSGISVEAHIEVKPEIQIDGYRNVPVEVIRREIGDEQVNETLQTLRERMTAYQTVDRPAGDGDFVVIDLVPYRESGELNEEAGQKNYGVALGSENLLPEFRSGLVGLRAGDEKDIHVAYPEDFPEKQLAGVERKYHIKVSEVKEALIPELDDAFAKSVAPEVGSLAELKERIRADLQREEDDRYRHDAQEKVIDVLIERHPFDVPETMVENYLASIVEEDRRRRPRVDDEEKREREVRELFREPAVRAVRKFLIMESVVRQEGMRVTDEEFENKVKSLAESTGRPLDEVSKVFRDPRHRLNLENEILDQKVLDFLREEADIKVA